MNDERDKSDDKTADVPGPIGGERLAEARRDQQISVLEVAKELHIDELKVRALEQNNFEALGAAVFAKGHMRKYAQLVGVQEEDVLADYYQMTRSAELPPVVVGRRKTHKEFSPLPWIAAIILLMIVAAVYWWLGVRAVPTEPATEPDQPPISAPPEEQTTAAPIATPQEDTVAEPEPQEATPPPVDDGQMRMVLNFSGDCWTEISDAAGQRLFFNMGRAGRTIELTGIAPFTVLFGNAENVSVTVDGSNYPIVPSTPGSRTARLSIDKP